MTPDYTITLNPTTLTILPGAADVTTVTLTRTDFDGEVTFSVSGAPAGITAGFAPPSTTGDNSTLTISASAITAPGDLQHQRARNGHGRAIARGGSPSP